MEMEFLRPTISMIMGKGTMQMRRADNEHRKNQARKQCE
jgi:hypothetical protein